MKFFFAALFSLSFSSAYASYFATNCSNARGTVSWESGHNTNTMTLTTLNGKKMKVNIDRLVIKFKEKTTLDVKEINECGFYSKKEIFAGKVVIYPSAQNPVDLTRVSENNEIETEAICTDEITGRTSC